MLYIMRHGKTDWNALKKLQGRTDIPLNEEGRMMAINANKEYSDVHFDICYCSPLLRAKETAKLFLNGRDIPIVIDDRLSEMCFGEYEGIENSFNISSCNVNVLFKDPANYVADKGAESIEELFKRTGEFLKEVVYPLLDDNKDVLIVGHGAMNSSIICQVRGLGKKDFWSEGIENCKLKQLI